VDGARGVQSAEHEVTGLGRLDRDTNRFEVAHLADQDHVGVHSEGLAQAGSEVGDVVAYLALADYALGRSVDVFDGILNRDDAARLEFVEMVYHCRQGGCFATARDARQQNQTAVNAGNGLQYRGHLEFFNRWDLHRDAAQGQSQAFLLVKGHTPKSFHVAELVGEIHTTVGLQQMAHSRRNDLGHNLLDFLSCGLFALHAYQRAVDAKEWLAILKNVDVGSFVLD